MTEELIILNNENDELRATGNGGHDCVSIDANATHISVLELIAVHSSFSDLQACSIRL